MKVNYLVGFLMLLTLFSGIAWLVLGLPQLEPVTIILGSIVAILQVGEITKINRIAGLLIGILGIGFFIFGISQALSKDPLPDESTSEAVNSISSVEAGGDIIGSTIIDSGGGNVNIALGSTEESPPLLICTVIISEDSCLAILRYAESSSEQYGCLQDGAKIQVTGYADPYYEISAYGIESVFVYEDRGLFVSEVSNSSSASDAGLEYGDIILLINDAPVTDIPDISTYLVQFAEQEISLLLKRDGQEKTLFITLPSYSSIGTYPTTYLRQVVHFSYERINPDGLKANRGYVLSSQVMTSVFGGNVDVTTYVSCPAQ